MRGDQERRPSLAVHTLGVVLLLGIVVAPAGCRSHTRGKGEIQFWAMGREGEVAAALMPEFEHEHPGAHVRVQQVPWSAAHEKLLTAYVGGSTPDVFQLGSTWVAEFAALDALEPLDERLAQSREVGVDRFFPGVFDANRIGGSTWAVPWYVDTRVVFYRADLLATVNQSTVPHRWAEWMAAMRRLKAGLPPDHYPMFLPVDEWEPLVILAMQYGADFLRDGGRYGDFRSPAFREAFARYLQIYREKLAPGRRGTQIANLYRDFADGMFCFYITGPWNLGEFARRLPSALQPQWQVAPMPSVTADWPGTSIAGGASLAMFRGSRNRELAWQLIEFLTAPAAQQRLYALNGNLPANRSAWDDPALRADERVEAFRLQLTRVKAPPAVPEWERIAATLSQWSDAAVRGDVTVDEALAELDVRVDAILEKRRWMLERHGRAGSKP
jgi:multiple sugar transport system substrate-binding protein